MTYLCKSCGGEGPIHHDVPCSSCGRRNFVLNAEPGELKLTGFPVGFVVEGDPNNSLGRRVENRPASGGTSDSSITDNGSFQSVLSGNLDRGRTGEPHVIKILVNSLRQLGHDVSAYPDARDEFGEDGILLLDGNRIALQIVTVPNHPGPWKELHLSDSARISGDLADAITLLRETILAKSAKAGGAVLALDLTYFGAIVNRKVVDAYLASYGDPAFEFSFHSVWLVGPSPRSTLELRGDRESV